MQSNDRSQAQTTCENLDQCSDCGSKSIPRDHGSGESVCDDCGLVLLENIIDTRHPPIRSDVIEVTNSKPLPHRLRRLDSQVNASPSNDAEYSGWKTLERNLSFHFEQNGYHDNNPRIEDAKRMYVSMKNMYTKKNNTTSLFRGHHGPMRRAVVAHIIFNEMITDPRPWYQKCQHGGMPIQPKKNNPEFKKLRLKIVNLSRSGLGPEGNYLATVDDKHLDAFMRRMLKLVVQLLHRRSNDKTPHNDRFLRPHEIETLRNERFRMMMNEVFSIHKIPLDSGLENRLILLMNQHPSYPSYQNMRALDKFHLELLYQLMLQRNDGTKIARSSLLNSQVSSSSPLFYEGRSEHWTTAALEIIGAV